MANGLFVRLTQSRHTNMGPRDPHKMSLHFPVVVITFVTISIVFSPSVSFQPVKPSRGYERAFFKNKYGWVPMSQMYCLCNFLCVCLSVAIFAANIFQLFLAAYMFCQNTKIHNKKHNNN